MSSFRRRRSKTENEEYGIPAGVLPGTSYDREKMTKSNQSNLRFKSLISIKGVEKYDRGIAKRKSNACGYSGFAHKDR